MDEPVCITWERSQVGLNWPGHLKQHLIWHGVRESMCITLLWSLWFPDLTQHPTCEYQEGKRKCKVQVRKRVTQKLWYTQPWWGRQWKVGQVVSEEQDPLLSRKISRSGNKGGLLLGFSKPDCKGELKINSWTSENQKKWWTSTGSLATTT